MSNAISIKGLLICRTLIWYWHHLSLCRFLPRWGGQRWLFSRWHCLKHPNTLMNKLQESQELFSFMFHKKFTPHRNSFSWADCWRKVAAGQWTLAERESIVILKLPGVWQRKFNFTCSALWAELYSKSRWLLEAAALEVGSGARWELEAVDFTWQFNSHKRNRATLLLTFEILNAICVN